MDWKRLYAMYCVTSRSLTKACSMFWVLGVATQAKNNADRVVTPLCCGKKQLQCFQSIYCLYYLKYGLLHWISTPGASSVSKAQQVAAVPYFRTCTAVTQFVHSSRYVNIHAIWASPTLVLLHCACVCACLLACLRPYTIEFKMSTFIKCQKFSSWL